MVLCIMNTRGSKPQATRLASPVRENPTGHWIVEVIAGALGITLMLSITLALTFGILI